MTHINKLAILQWWASLNATQKLLTWQAVVIFVLFNGIISLTIAYNDLRKETKHELSVEKAKADQINKNWILYLQKSIENDRELYLKTRMLDDELKKKQNENTNTNY